MATYVVSDIHGAYYTFLSLLNKVQFDNSKDELYILGDIVDRGPHSDKMLEWAYQQPSNVHFLLGNHEDMCLATMKRYEEFLKNNSGLNYHEADRYLRYDFSYTGVWTCYNGGINTFNYLADLPRERRKDILDWMDNWPLYYDITVNGQRFLLVHAGIAPNGIRFSQDYLEDGKDIYYNIDGIEKPQWSQTLLWTRDAWFLEDLDLPYKVIFGHTPTFYLYNALDWPDIDMVGKSGEILLFNHKYYAIDTGREKMGMIRLDDMEEFYKIIKL